ncbi:ribosome-binding factor A [Candidatus Termititenax persephonae]|uniref:Ribosome-binding factor A n=1 Tax=Candidatus Termititenax persephonae TaxID=2218525 RepID=A0A388TE98_9BACT|nr:ribosome-binding factor A [Candidatus Termititenax persephonae]
MMSRAERLAGLLKAEVGEIILHKLNDQRIGFVSITEVKASADLTTAKIYISCWGGQEEKKKSLRGLISSIPYIRGLLADSLQTRVVPKLRFVLDDSLAEGDRLLTILNKLGKARTEIKKSQPSQNPL